MDGSQDDADDDIVILTKANNEDTEGNRIITLQSENEDNVCVCQVIVILN
jgi:hypothetical protein